MNIEAAKKRFFKQDKKDNLPTVSVIIPMKNEEEHITRCLDSIVVQDYPKALIEVLVVDGMSQDSSRRIVSEFVGRFSFIKLLDNPKRATTYALNMGITESRGQIIVRVDAHCSIDPDYIYSCVDTLQRTGAENVGGLMRPIGTTFIQMAIALAMSCPFGMGSGKFHYSKKEMFVDTVYLGAYRREVFEKIGLYDQDAHYGEDDELNYRLIKSGGKIFLSPRIKSQYYPRSSLSGLWKQYYRYGCGKVRTIKKHGRPASWRHLVPAVFILCTTGSLILCAMNPAFGWLVVGILGSYLLSSMIFSSKISFKNGLTYLPILPVVFATLHLSYGIGFLRGSLRLRLSDRK